MQDFQLPASWLKALGPSFDMIFLEKLGMKLSKLEQENINFFPPINKVFRALQLTNYSKVKVLILGQDPYYQSGQANGLAFSVDTGSSVPPSLQNIYKELHSDLGLSIPTHGDLTPWSNQGVLLLNSVLTVEEGYPNSHKSFGWSEITDAIISTLSNKGGIVFVLWGNFAQAKTSLIDNQVNHVICSPHPSPLSSYRGFFGSKPFSRINSILAKENLAPIDWQIK